MGIKNRTCFKSFDTTISHQFLFDLSFSLHYSWMSTKNQFLLKRCSLSLGDFDRVYLFLKLLSGIIRNNVDRFKYFNSERIRSYFPNLIRSTLILDKRVDDHLGAPETKIIRET